MLGQSVLRMLSARIDAEARPQPLMWTYAHLLPITPRPVPPRSNRGQNAVIVDDLPPPLGISPGERQAVMSFTHPGKEVLEGAGCPVLSPVSQRPRPELQEAHHRTFLVRLVRVVFGNEPPGEPYRPL